MTATKTCPRCQRTLPLSEFSVNRGKHDGLQTECKTCHRDMRRKCSHCHRAIDSGHAHGVCTACTKPKKRILSDEEIEAIRRMLAAPYDPRKDRRRRQRCPCGQNWESECAACEKKERAGLVFSQETSEVEL